MNFDPTLKPDETVRSGESHPFAPDQSWPALALDLRLDRPSLRDDDLEVRALIGEGGMGRVLLARQHSLARDVALKTAKPDAGPVVRDAILTEGVITGQLEHPSIVPVHALGVDVNGWPALVMKRIDGVTWDALLADPASPGWEGWDGTPADRLPGHLQLLMSVCNALHFAHSKGVVHRDVKPANVLIGRFGDVYLADWGVAAPAGSATRSLTGTLVFVAPEMVTGGVVDARSDVYLLGSTLHLVLTGTPRHLGNDARSVIAAAALSEPFVYGPKVPPELARLANRACHRDPAQRPQTARAFRDELAAFLKHREARALADQSIARVRVLEQIGTEVVALTPVQERMLAEARFGLEQSLAQFPENPAAREALDQLERHLAERNRRTAELEQDFRERDPTRGTRLRTISLAMMTVLYAGAVVVWRNVPVTPERFLGAALGLFAISICGALVMRREVYSSRFNRQIVLMLNAALFLLVVNRGVGLWVGTSISEMAIRECLFVATVMFSIGVTLLRWVIPVSVAYVIAAVAGMVMPANAELFLGLCSAVTCAFATWSSARSTPRAAVRDAG